MDIAVSPKTARRQGATKEHILTDLRLRRTKSRAVFGKTLRAEVLLDCGFVASPVQIPADMAARRSTPLSLGMVSEGAPFAESDGKCAELRQRAKGESPSWGDSLVLNFMAAMASSDPQPPKLMGGPW